MATLQATTITGGLTADNMVGMIMPFATSTVPTGWLVCEGAAVSRTTYSALFSAIGTTWGSGNGSTTFNVPDMRGAIPRGTGTAGVNSDYVGPNLGGYQDDQNASHNHTASSSTSGNTNNTGNHSHKHSGNTPIYGGHWANAGAFRGWIYTQHQYDNTAGAHSHSATISTSTNIGNSGSTEARVYSRGCKYCIKF